MVTIYYKKLRENAKDPERAHESEAGADVFASTKHIVKSRGGIDVIEYGTGLALAIPKGYALDFRARSSVWKQGMILCNGVGTIDEAYHDEVEAFFYKILDGQYENDCQYNIGDKIGQLVLQPYVDPREIRYVEVDELKFDEDRGGGFGSTGR